MFWLYAILVLLPAVGFYRFLNRDHADDTSVFLPLFVFVVQLFLVVAGGWIALSIAGLIFMFGAFLLYGAWYMPRLEKLVVFPNGQIIRFNYRDRLLRYSQRRVRVTDCDNTYINGFCFLRGAERTFKRSRIIDGVIVESTGEIVDPTAPAHPSHLGK